MFAKYKALGTIALLFAISSVSAAEEHRVWVYDSGTKPAAAAQTGHYELRRVSGKQNMSMCCDECMKKVSTTVPGTKPAVSHRTEAYICTHCDTMVWCDRGTEVKHSDKADVEAMTKIERELRAPVSVSRESRRVEVSEPYRWVDRSAKPALQALQKMERR